MAQAIAVDKLFGATVKFAPDFSNAAYSIYEVKAITNPVPLFDVKVNNLTSEIEVVFPDMTSVAIDAKVKMVNDLTDQGVTSRPSSDSIKSIIYPRIIGLLADKMTA